MGVARRADDVQAELLALAPPGWAINTSADGVFADFVRPLSVEISRFETQAEAQLVEVDQRQADRLLTDYERVLGADPAGRNPEALQLADRRLIAFQRWTSRGGQSIAFFVGLAAALGVMISITEYRTTICGAAECGASELQPSPNQFVWRITLPQTRLVIPECGASECGDLLGDFTSNLVEGLIRLYAPAHTVPVFSYTG